MERRGRIPKFLIVLGLISLVAVVYGVIEAIFGMPGIEMVQWAILALLISHILDEA